MFLEEPQVEFVAVDPLFTGETSSGTGGTDSCKGPTSINRNCSHFNTFMDDCGYYVQGEFDENY